MFPLLLVLACERGPGHDRTMFDACVTYLEVACGCGDVEYCGDDPDVQCEVYDERYCDPESGMFDADICEDVSRYTTDAALDWSNCTNEVYGENCDAAAAYAECGDAPWADE